MRIPIRSLFARLPRQLRRRSVLTGVVVVVAAAAFGGWLLFRGSGSAAAVTTDATVTRGTVKETVAASGTVAAAHSSEEEFAVSGTVTHVYVAAGAHVRKGQALAAVDATTLRADRTAALSQLTAARDQLSEDEDAGASAVQLSADEASVSSARAALTQARQDVRASVLRATIAGTVTDVGLAVGDTVGSTGSSGSTGSAGSSSGASAGSSSSTISIVGGDHYVVDATLSPTDATKVKPGMEATLTVTGVDDPVYGTVQDVSLVAQAGDTGAAEFPVTIAVTGARKDLFAGVSASATITTQVRTGVLTVDTRAVHTDSDGTYVDKVVDGRTVRTAIKVGGTYGLQTEVTSGLKQGDVVQVVSFRVPAGGGGQRQGGFTGGVFPGGPPVGGGFPRGGSVGGLG